MPIAPASEMSAFQPAMEIPRNDQTTSEQAIGPMGLSALADAPRFHVEGRFGAGPDLVTLLRRM